jgi:hypothetical protein
LNAFLSRVEWAERLPSLICRIELVLFVLVRAMGEALVWDEISASAQVWLSLSE